MFFCICHSLFYKGYLKSELTANDITVTEKEDDWCTYSATPNFGALGKRCGKQMQEVKKGIMALTTEQVSITSVLFFHNKSKRYFDKRDIFIVYEL